MTFDPDAAVAEAFSLGRDEAERAEALLRRVATLAPSRPWAEARIALARHAYGSGELTDVEDLVRPIVDAPPDAVPASMRAVAAIVMAQAREMLDQPFDEQLMAESIEVCAASAGSDQLYYAGSGLFTLARHQVGTGRRNTGICGLERSADLFDRAGSMLGGPSALELLARVAIEDGRIRDACGYLDRGIARLREFPLGGFQVRGLEQKLVARRATLDP